MARPANPELRQEILRAATDIIESCGPDCVTMREVAEKVGYSPTTLYLYFKDKREVLKETVKAAFDELAEAIDAAAVGPTPLDEFRQRTRAYIVWGIMHPGRYQLMFQAPGDIQWTEEDMLQSSRAWVETRKVLQAAVAQGQFRPIEDLGAFGTAVLAAIHGVTSLVISRRLVRGALGLSPAELIATASTTAERLLSGLLSDVLVSEGA